MKNFAFGIVTTLLILATLAASEGGFNVVWEMEMKRPEAQKAVSEYISRQCEMRLWPNELDQLGKALQDHQNYSPTLHLTCFVDQPK